MWPTNFDLIPLHVDKDKKDRHWLDNLPARCCNPRTETGCGLTVIVRGECHRSYNVNYVLFGILWRFCYEGLGWIHPGMDVASGEALMMAWKVQYGWREFLGALEWYLAGWAGWPDADTPHSALTGSVCPDACRRLPGDPPGPWGSMDTPFNSIWYDWNYLG